MTIASSEKRLDWKNKIHLQKESGLSIERWCRENGIASHLFHYWKNRIYPSAINKADFIELKERKGFGIAIEYHGFRIFVDRHFDPAVLKHCLSLLKEIKC